MKRQSISFTEPNDDWLSAQVESREFSSKSEVVNDLIRQARHQQQKAEWLRAQLVKGEQSGFIEVTENTRHEMLSKFKARAQRDDKL